MNTNIENTVGQLSELDPRITALANFLECDYEDISEASYGNNTFKYGNQEYLVLTDSEADDVVAEYIKESAWAFNASFLSSMTRLPEDMFIAVQDKCESSNDAVLQCIEQSCGLDEFVEQAVSADGRGHFLSGYDGNENESGEYFIYRTN